MYIIKLLCTEQLYLHLHQDDDHKAEIMTVIKSKYITNCIHLENHYNTRQHGQGHRTYKAGIAKHKVIFVLNISDLLKMTAKIYGIVHISKINIKKMPDCLHKV